MSPREGRTNRFSSLSLLLLLGTTLLAQAPPAEPWSTDPKTQDVVQLFQDLNRIPRCPGNEGGLRAWLQSWAKARNLTARADDTGNLVIRVPASPGLEQAPGVVLHAAMDMECAKVPGSTHDFAKDPILAVHKGEWLESPATSLGALDGMGIAVALSLAEEPVHPPLELLFTVQGCSTWRGAKALDAKSLEGKALLSLDGLREGTLYVGDTGLTEGVFSRLADSEGRPAALQVARLRVTGLKGGHGGVDIDGGGGNAIHLLARSLAALEAETPLRLSGLSGGTSQYQIPKEAGATLAFPPGQLDMLRARLDSLKRDFLRECPASPGLDLALEPLATGLPESLYTLEDSARVIAFLAALPSGVHARDDRFQGLPGVFNNLGQLKSGEFGVTLYGTQRSSTSAGLQELNQRLKKRAEAHGAQFRAYEWDAPWLSTQPSELLRRLRAAYARQFGQEPTVTLLCASAEAGRIARNCGIPDAVVLGPTVERINEPGERVHLPSIQRLRALLAGLLAAYR